MVNGRAQQILERLAVAGRKGLDDDRERFLRAVHKKPDIEFAVGAGDIDQPGLDSGTVNGHPADDSAASFLTRSSPVISRSSSAKGIHIIGVCLKRRAGQRIFALTLIAVTGAENAAQPEDEACGHQGINQEICCHIVLFFRFICFSVL
jgi:hypothetical protein